MNQEFPYIVKPVNEQEYSVKWVVEYIDFPGITGGGDTAEEAIEIAREALQMYQEVMERKGKPLPQPTNFSVSGRITLRIPKTLHIKTIEMAERDGVSLNTYIIDALSKKVYGYDALSEWMDKFTNLSQTIFVKRSNHQGKFKTPFIGNVKSFDNLSFNNMQFMSNKTNCKEEKPYVYQH